MARKLRLEYPGAIYHVINRGDHREPIFRDDGDRQRSIVDSPGGHSGNGKASGNGNGNGTPTPPPTPH